VFWRIFGSEYSRARPSTGYRKVRSGHRQRAFRSFLDAFLTVAVAALATWA